MAIFTVHVPFEQHDAYEVEADSIKAAVEIAPHDPDKHRSINIYESVEYDWYSSNVQSRTANHMTVLERSFSNLTGGTRAENEVRKERNDNKNRNKNDD